jgi:hypothetical protein
METLGYSFYHLAEGKTFVAKTGIFLEKEFLAKGVGGRKVDLDEIVDPSLEIPSSATEIILNAPSIEEEEGAPRENHVLLPSRLITCLHESANPRSGLRILYYRSC